MSIFDGTDEELTFGQALVEISNRVSWPTEAHMNAAVRAIQEEFGLLPPEPEAEPVDPREAELAERRELDKLREEQLAQERLELAELRAWKAGQSAGSGADAKAADKPAGGGKKSAEKET